MTSQQLRGNAKARITRAVAFADSITDQVSTELIEIRIEKLETAWAHFCSYHSACLVDMEPSDITVLEAEYEEYENKYFTARSICVKSFRERQLADKQKAALEVLANQQSAFLEKLDNSMNTCSSANLPVITVTPFSGSYKDWPSFRDMFSSSVDSKSNLTSAQKFHYLKSFLRDEALDLIKQIPVSDANYIEAWERLHKRYNRVHLLVNSFIQSFMSLPTLSAPNTQTLRKITDGADEVVRGLQAAEKNYRDPWLIYILLNKLDEDTRHAWARKIGSRDNSTINELIEFLELRCDAFETCRPVNRSLTSRGKQSTPVRSHLAEARENSSRCPKCKSDHMLSQCSVFKGLGIEARRTFVRENSLCFNCLRLGHSSNRCRSTFRCRVCKSRHHSLVHVEHSNNSTSSPYEGISSSRSSVDSPAAVQPHHMIDSSNPSTSSPVITNHCLDLSLRHQTILPTVLAKIQDNQGQFIDCRILLDTGSQSSFITESLAQRLGLPRKHSRIPILGLSSKEAGHTKGCISIHLISRFNSSHLCVNALVLGKLTSSLTCQTFEISSWDYIKGLDLADPYFNVCSSVDVLLGVDRVWTIFKPQQINGPEGKPLAQNTTFGWVVTGELVDSDPCTSSVALSSFHSTVDIDHLLQRFWELEEVPAMADQSNEDPAEIMFRENVRRSQDGRYVVPLLFKIPSPSFGDTLSAAISRLHSMERRFRTNSDLHRQYTQFMQEYADLGHMELIPPEHIKTDHGKHFYLPHHAVFKPGSSTTKLRVVFDGSVKDSSGQSLNNQLFIGPPIQRDLFGVTLRFREYRYVFTADIVKMFRQIWIRENETDFQRIVWRETPSEPVKHFRLKTVTYGTASAPYLAVRVLKQLSEDFKLLYPNAAKAILTNAYVDDIMTGEDSIYKLLQLQSELVDLLSVANIKLRKWSSNCWALLAKLPSEDCEYTLVDAEQSQSLVKVLGMFWNPSSDCFSYRLTPPKQPVQSTRRTFLSEIARIFDPLGLLAPSTIPFKIMFQELWSSELKLGWDDPLPPEIAARWMKYRRQLHCFEEIRITRHMFSSAEDIELHGFSDASSLAYAAVIYARVQSSTGESKITIVAAKTKVAPLKPVSIPRLELCGALLLSRLVKLVKCSLKTDNLNISAWYDSEIVLHWLSSSPRRWTTFVANRTAAILETIPRHSWHYVSSESNPADCASRGVPPSELIDHNLWWNGPPWLSSSKEHWPYSEFSISPQIADCDPVKIETRLPKKHVLFMSMENNFIRTLIEKKSSWNRIVLIVACCLRFVANCRPNSTNLPYHGSRFKQFQSAKVLILKYVQYESYSTEIQQLQTKKTLPTKSTLIKYSPFLDIDGLLRVGGRITNGNISYNMKHPILLPKNNTVSPLIIKDVHLRYMHAGISEMFAILRQQYWIEGSRNLCRSVIHRCKPCFMQRKLTSSQLMADLPAQRVRPSRPFYNTGCDYAGPLTIKLSRGRNPKHSKAYIAIFVCMTTKAIHIEVVSDLTTDAFLAALRRFVARRGLCANLYSDNGTNFQGARRCLTEMHKLVLSQPHNDMIATSLAKDGIAWHFIPPSAPHFGGLWEAGVKSIKLHLRRVVGSSILTFEELATVTIQIEAILNSRPLCLVSDTDLNPLTPSHFLIGVPLTAVPEPSHLGTPINRLSHWNYMQNMVQGFWKRWSLEYLTTLQERPKWQQPKPNIKTGDVVVIKEPNLPPTKWILGRVADVNPGPDQLIRVATVKTSAGTFVRPISKLALLPLS